VNNLTVAGTLGRDMEVKFLPNGDAVGNFSVADSQGKDKPTIWWNCQLWGKRAESLGQYLVKGQAVTVSGSVSEREWTNKDGVKQKAMDIRVSDVALQGGKREHNEETGSRRPSPQPRAQTLPDDGFSDDIPF